MLMMKSVIAALVFTLTATACGASAGSGAGPGDRIPQPKVNNPGLAPDSKRVDLKYPKFSNPTHVINPLFPVSRQASVLMLGKVDGKPFRTEVTLLPDTRIIEWGGQRIETLVSQYLAYLDGRIQEVAYDHYAQDDNGNVWYFGEDVSDFEDGVIRTKLGTWMAPDDGPAAMIMPGHPKIGNVFRTENIPGIAFEEVRVKAVDQTFDGPLGPIRGGLVGSELHYYGGDTELKQFAPGYGEFYTASGGDIEALALAVPTNAASERVPAELVTLARAVDDAYESTPAVDRLSAAWDRYKQGDVPRLILPRMDDAMSALADAVKSRDADATRAAAVDVTQYALDLQLRYRPVAEVDLARFHFWLTRMLIDLSAKDEAAVNGDSFTLDYIRDRIVQSLDTADADTLNVGLEELQNAVQDGETDVATKAAAKLRSEIGSMKVVR